MATASIQSVCSSVSWDAGTEPPASVMASLTEAGKESPLLAISHSWIAGLRWGHHCSIFTLVAPTATDQPSTVSSGGRSVAVVAFATWTVNTAFVNPTTDTPGMNQMKEDLDAWKAGEGEKVDSGTIAGYTSTDMFIQALKTVAKGGKNKITPEAVQAAAAKQTWELKGVAGPTSYPKATVNSYPSCNSLYISDGTQWTTVVDYGCSTKTYPVK